MVRHVFLCPQHLWQWMAMEFRTAKEAKKCQPESRKEKQLKAAANVKGKCIGAGLRCWFRVRAQEKAIRTALVTQNIQQSICVWHLPYALERLSLIIRA